MTMELSAGASSSMTRIAVVSSKVEDALPLTLPEIDQLMLRKNTIQNMGASMPVLLKEPSIQAVMM